MSEPTPTTAAPKPSRLARVLTPVAVLLVMLGLVEGVLQVAAPLPYSSRLWWVADGHVKGRLEPGQEPVNPSGNVVHINSLGFRGPERTWEPARGTLRLEVFGGSSAFCYDVTDEENTWPSVLERALAEALHMPVEVVNLALPGYDTSNSKVNYLFTGRALHPHVAVVYHTWNDMKFFRLIDETEGAHRWVLSGRDAIGSNLSAFSHFFWNSQIVQRFALVIRTGKRRQEENRYTSLEEEGSAAHAPVGPRAWAWFDENFEDFARFARADGVLPVLVSQATLAHPDLAEDRETRMAVANDMLGMTYPRLAESWLEANRRIEAVAAGEGAVFVDGYGTVPPTLENMKDHVHLLDPGTELLGRAIAARLMAEPRFVALAERVRRGEDPREAPPAPAAVPDALPVDAGTPAAPSPTPSAP